MSKHDDELRTGLIAAVQAELNRHAAAVNADLERVRSEGQREREALRSTFGEHVRTLAAAVESGNAKSEQFQSSLRDALDKQVAQAEERANRRIEEVIATIDGLVEASARPHLTAIRDEQAELNRRLEALAENLRKFDEQAARMVQFFDESMQAVAQRATDAQAELLAKVHEQTTELTSRIDTALIDAVRHKSETTQLVNQRVSDVEERINGRILAAETRAKEDAGTRIADIDAHLGRVSAGLDSTLVAFNDRMSGIESDVTDVRGSLDALNAKVEAVDETALDELKEKLSSAVGEAMLVRIEMERLDKSTGERFDSLTVRVTDVETQLADATMDVSTAVQLERLEELERAVQELDPTQFVKKDELSPVAGAFAAPNGNGHGGNGTSELAATHDMDQIERVLQPPLHAE